MLSMQEIARLLTHYDGVHSRLCLDEAEVAEHVTGLMRSLAECPFKYVTCFLHVSTYGEFSVDFLPFPRCWFFDTCAYRIP